jgi:hypothetical protein
MELGEILKLTGAALAIGSAMSLVAGALWQRRTSRRLGSNDLGHGLGSVTPLKRKRLIWRGGENPYYVEAQYETPVSAPALEAVEGKGSEGRVAQTEGEREAKRRIRPRGSRKIINLYIDKGLYAQFKGRCLESGITLSEAMEKLISQFLKEEQG